MFLTFDRATRELIHFNDIYGGTKNINIEPFVYLDDYITIKRDDTVDFIETTFDPVSQMESIIPGQYVLTDSEIELLKCLTLTSTVLEEGKQVVAKKWNDIYSAFVFEKANMARRILNGTAAEDERNIFKIDATVLGISQDDIIVAAKENATKKMRALNSIHVHFEKFKSDVESATETDVINELLISFKSAMENLIPDP